MQSGETLIQIVYLTVLGLPTTLLANFYTFLGTGVELKVLLAIVSVTISFIWYFDIDSIITAGLNLSRKIIVY